MRRVLMILVVLWPAVLSAQPAPIVARTVRTTDTTSTSVRVGCTAGGSCTGGIVAGPADLSQIILGGGGISIASAVPGVTTNKLYNNAGTLTWNGIVLATGASLSGTINKIPVFTASNAVGDSIMTQSGTTITVASTLVATTLTGTLSTASQPNVTTLAGLTTAGALATVGTITSGTWSGTIIGIAKGGTGVDLSATGGTSQFLRQNGAGATISVVRPAVADLSDAGNVALLGSVNTFTALGSHTFTAGSAGLNEILVRNTVAGTGTSAQVRIGNDADSGIGRLFVGSSTFTTSGPYQANTFTVGSTGFMNVGTTQAASLLFWTNNLQRWGINSAGDHTFGASSNIADSSGTPTLNSGGGTSPSIAGNDFSFIITLGTGTFSGVGVAFGHTFATAPSCSIGDDGAVGTTNRVTMNTTTTTASFAASAGNFVASSKLYIMCRGR